LNRDIQVKRFEKTNFEIPKEIEAGKKDINSKKKKMRQGYPNTQTKRGGLAIGKQVCHTGRREKKVWVGGRLILWGNGDAEKSWVSNGGVSP